MTDGQSMRPIIDPPPWLRFVSYFALFWIAVSRHRLLPALGYSDAGQPKWIFAGIMAVAITTWIALSARPPFGWLFANSPRAMQLAYTVIFMVAGTACLSVVFADLSLTNPYFWVPAAIVLLLGLVEWALWRRFAAK
jgi:hypothetical protein